MSLGRSNEWNPGGGNWVEILPVVGVDSYTRSSTMATPAVTLRAGFSWIRIYCTQGTLAYREIREDDDQGEIYKVEIKGFSPGDSKAKRSDLVALAQYRRFLVRFRDNARLTRLAGTAAESLLLAYELTTDSDVPGQRGFSLTWSGTLTQPVAYE